MPYYYYDVGSATDAGAIKVGYFVATGNFNNDEYDDVAVSSHKEDIGSIVDAGSFTVIYGSANGLTGTGGVVFHHLFFTKNLPM